MERNTRQRQAVLDALAGSGRTLSPPEILALAQMQAPGLNLSTVYRQVKSLEEAGDLVKVQLPGQAARFEARCGQEAAASALAVTTHADAGAPSTRGRSAAAARSRPHGPTKTMSRSAQPSQALPLPHHHHHFHCLVCDQVVPIHGCPGAMQDLAPPGCSVERHDLVLHGRCASCAPQAAR